MTYDKNLKKFCKKNNYTSLIAIFIDWLMIFIAIYIAIKLDNVIIDLIIIWFIGIKQYSLGEVFVHEASHNNLFSTTKLNTKLQLLFAYPFFASVEAYRKEHIPHHNQLGKKGIDPLCTIYKRHGLNVPNPNLFWIWFVRPLLGICSIEFFTDKIKNLDYKNFKGTIIVYIILLFISYYFNFIQQLFLYWLIPFLWCIPAFYCWQEIEDHFNAKGIARTNIGFIRNFLAHNTGYHYAHHQCPGIPWFYLRKAHLEFFSDCRDISLNFFDTYRCITKKIPSNELNNICK